MEVLDEEVLIDSEVALGEIVAQSFTQPRVEHIADKFERFVLDFGEDGHVKDAFFLNTFIAVFQMDNGITILCMLIGEFR